MIMKVVTSSQCQPFFFSCCHSCPQQQQQQHTARARVCVCTITARVITKSTLYNIKCHACVSAGCSRAGHHHHDDDDDDNDNKQINE